MEGVQTDSGEAFGQALPIALLDKDVGRIYIRPVKPP
jgi:hypothetical protein